MEYLPNELLLQILNIQDATQLTKLCQINKLFSTLCRDELLWRRLVNMKFGHVDKICDSWFETFKSLLRKTYIVIEKDYGGSITLLGVYYDRNKAINELTDYIMDSEIYSPDYYNQHNYSPEFIRELEDFGVLLDNEDKSRFLNEYKNNIINTLSMDTSQKIYVEIADTYYYILSN